MQKPASEIAIPDTLLETAESATSTSWDSGKHPPVRPILRSVRREASSHLIPVHLIKGAEVRAVFRVFRAKSRHEIATMLAQMFPELLWKLPPKRKIWESEHFRMAMFDTVALGFAYWQHDGTREPTLD